MSEKQENINENNEVKVPKPLFTRSRILFLIVVFLVMSMPLMYRYLSFLL